MCDLRVFRNAYGDLQYAKKSYYAFYNDERAINAIAYSLQQCVEKLIKAHLECVGVTVPKTHDIEKLIRMVKTNGSSMIITEWIADHADTLTKWEASSRYDVDFYVETMKIRTAIKEVDTFFELNGMSENLFDVITDEVKEKIRKCIPKTMKVESNMDWNVLYIVFKKKIDNGTSRLDAF